MKICHQCGAKLEDTAAFCSACGAKQSSLTVKHSVPKQKPTLKIVAGLVTLAIALGVIVYGIREFSDLTKKPVVPSEEQSSAASETTPPEQVPSKEPSKETPKEEQKQPEPANELETPPDVPTAIRTGEAVTVTGTVIYSSDPSELGEEYCSIALPEASTYEWADRQQGGKTVQSTSDTAFFGGESCRILREYEGCRITVQGVYQEDIHGAFLLTQATVLEGQKNNCLWKYAYIDRFRDVLANADASADFSRYTLYDIQDDGTPELFLFLGTCEADTVLEIWSYTEKDGAVLINAAPAGHTSVCGIADRDAYLLHYGHMGSERIEKVTVYPDGLVREVLQEGQVQAYLSLQTLTEYTINDSTGLNWMQNETENNRRVLDNASPSIGTTDEYLLPDSGSRYLTYNDLERLSQRECALARNEIYARHHRIFSNREIAAYFNSQSWYTGLVPADRFDTSLLNDFERANADFISQYEKDTWGSSYY